METVASSRKAATLPPPVALGLVALLLAGPLTLLVLKLNPSLDGVSLHSPLGHVLISGGASLLGALLALLVLRVAIRARDARVFFVGLGFLSVASIFLIHSVATPDVLIEGRGLATTWSGILSLLAGAFFFAVSGLRLPAVRDGQRVTRIAPRILAVYVVAWLLYSGTLLFWTPLIANPVGETAQAASHDHMAAEETSPNTTSGESDEYGPGVEEGSMLAAAYELGEHLALPLTLLGMLGYTFAAISHLQIYRATPTAAGLAIVCGIVLLGEALLTQHFSQVYHHSFWLYHIEEFAGFAVISYAVLVAYRRGQSGEGLFEGLFLGGTRTRIRAEYASAMHALTTTLARGDEATPALRHLLRDRLGLPETQLDVLEQTAAAVAHERRQRHELEQLNAELVRVQNDRDQLTQMIVHDLKNPLTAMLGFLEILRLHTSGEDERMLINQALRSGRNLTGLIDDLLDVGKMEQGRLELVHTSINPALLLDECATQMRGWCAQERKELVLDIEPRLGTFIGDARLLRRVVLNLISNAIKHTPPETLITLGARSSVERATPWILLSVADNGPGIPPEQLPLIFDKYHHGEATNVHQSSTGLGLTFCRMAAEAHGGSIEVTSTPGAGAIFVVRLPVVSAPHVAQATEP